MHARLVASKRDFSHTSTCNRVGTSNVGSNRVGTNRVESGLDSVFGFSAAGFFSGEGFRLTKVHEAFVDESSWVAFESCSALGKLDSKCGRQSDSEPGLTDRSTIPWWTRDQVWFLERLEGWWGEPEGFFARAIPNLDTVFSLPAVGSGRVFPVGWCGDGSDGWCRDRLRRNRTDGDRGENIPVRRGGESGGYLDDGTEGWFPSIWCTSKPRGMRAERIDLDPGAWS
jgi:hypothetical protein